MEQITKTISETFKSKVEREYGNKREWTGWEVEAVITHSPFDMTSIRYLTNRTWMVDKIDKKTGKKYKEMTRSADFKADTILGLLAQKMNIKMGFDDVDEKTLAIFEMCYRENRIHIDYYKWLIQRGIRKISEI